MAQEPYEGRNKFREGLRLLGEAATDLARQGLDTVERLRRDQARRVTEDMRRAGAEALRQRGITVGIAEPAEAGNPVTDTITAEERLLRTIAEEVYVRMTEARLVKERQPSEPATTSREHRPPLARDEP